MKRFIRNTFNKLQELNKLIDSTESKALIEIDGGVSDNNAQSLLASGADILVAGSFVFNSEDPLKTISDLKKVPA